jgi:hypothetical protein
MNFALAGGATLVVLSACVFFFLIRRLTTRDADVGASLDWSKDFSINKYRPMERLFLEEDYEFLQSQPGYDPQIAKKLRADRRRIFRHYLRCLSRDFDRLYMVAKFVLLHSPQDRPDLAAALLKQRALFQYAMALVHCRLVLHALGLGTVDARHLVGALDAMRGQLSALTLGVQASAA